MTEILCFLLFHLIGDFVFQPVCLAKKKKENLLFLILHSLIYTMCLAIPVSCYFDVFYAIPILAVIASSHFFIDLLRNILDSKYEKTKVSYWVFIVDQMLHIGVVIGAVLCFYSPTSYNWIEAICKTTSNYEEVVRYSLAIVLVLSPASVLVRNTFGFVFGYDEEKEENRVGNYIGKLERIVIIMLGFMGLYTSIAIVLTAKSIARFKNINEDQRFAEKYLVGTLFSLVIAIIGLMIIKL